MTIQTAVQQRNISRLFHFTHSDNLSSILENGIKTRCHLDEDESDYNFNDESRYDGHLDATCLSISFPNSLMLFKYRNSKPGNWVLLEIEPSVLWEKDCAFYPTNAASNNVRFEDKDSMKDVQAFNALFSKNVFGMERATGLSEKYPTDVQAEVLVFDVIEPSYIKRTIHPNKESSDHFFNLYPETTQSYYANLNGRTLYSQRFYFLG